MEQPVLLEQLALPEPLVQLVRLVQLVPLV